MSSNKQIYVFLLIQLAMISFSYTEAVLEGYEGWAKDRKVWRFKVSRNHDYTSYHLVTYYILFPLVIIALPLLVAGFSWQLFWLLLASYLIGIIFEDFMWFVFNPERPFNKWNPKDTTWYPWLVIKRFALPVSYVVKFVIGVLMLVFLVG